MEHTVTIQLSSDTIGFLRQFLQKPPTTAWSDWAPWGAIIVALVALGVNSWVQFWLASRNFQRQLKLEAEKGRLAARRKYLEDGYRDILDLMKNTEDLANTENQNLPLTAEIWSAGWRTTRSLRMNIDFSDSKELAQQFSSVDSARIEVEKAVTSRRNQISGPKMPIIPKAFAEECDKLQNLFRDALAGRVM